MTSSSTTTTSTHMTTITLMTPILPDHHLVVLGRQDPKLTRRVGKETHLPLAILPVLAGLGPIPGRMKPALENPVRELTLIPFSTRASPVLGTHRPGVMILPRITSPRLLARMSEGAVGPVVAPAASTPPHLELEHSKLIRRVGVGIEVESVVGVPVEGEELLHERGGVRGGAVGVEVGVRGDGSGGAAGEELAGRDIEIVKVIVMVVGFAGGGKEVESVICTHSAHCY